MSNEHLEELSKTEDQSRSSSATNAEPIYYEINDENYDYIEFPQASAYMDLKFEKKPSENQTQGFAKGRRKLCIFLFILIGLSALVFIGIVLGILASQGIYTNY
jgi:hypothetical protein